MIASQRTSSREMRSFSHEFRKGFQLFGNGDSIVTVFPPLPSTGSLFMQLGNPQGWVAVGHQAETFLDTNTVNSPAVSKILFHSP